MLCEETNHKLHSSGSYALYSSNIYRVIGKFRVPADEMEKNMRLRGEFLDKELIYIGIDISYMLGDGYSSWLFSGEDVDNMYCHGKILDYRDRSRYGDYYLDLKSEKAIKTQLEDVCPNWLEDAKDALNIIVVDHNCSLYGKVW